MIICISKSSKVIQMKMNSKYKKATAGTIEPNDIKKNTRHLAPLLLMADISYIDQNHKIVQRAKVIVGRCFTKTEARRFIDDMKRTEIEKHIGFDTKGPIYKKSYVDAIPYTYSDGVNTITECIERYTIVNKYEYFNIRKQQ